jgi:hypothetical protein
MLSYFIVSKIINFSVNKNIFLVLPKFYFMKLEIFYFLLLFSEGCFSQQKVPIEADRPDQTETPSIVPKGMLQLEAGFSYQKGDSKNQIFTLPSALWKYGFNENFELRLITEFVANENHLEKDSGVTPLLIGFKVKLFEENGIIPKTSFIGHISLPDFASSKYKSDFSAPEFRFSMQHSLSNKLFLGYNLGCDWDGYSHSSAYIYTLTTNYSFTDRFGSYVEIFGFALGDERPATNFDGGITYLITDNFMVDLSSGIGLNDTVSQYYVAVGFSYRN